MIDYNDPATFYTYKAIVLRWVDGDTVDVQLDLGLGIYRKERLRLEGIDAWETRGEERPQGLIATEFVKALAPEGSDVIIQTEKTGKYGRYIARVYVVTDDGVVSVNQQLLEHGHAEPY